MTTNSFGGALPRFDFPAQPAPAITRMARNPKALPLVLVAATLAAAAIQTTKEAQQPRSLIAASMASGPGMVPRGQGGVDKHNGNFGSKPNI
ncbi:hypothetical protein FSARC_777 [Fusarium sarcochroum]|uniref:Uncharacterized protein n=1 Tax=Fusarium sarcochroum TaxID=1208366 RepID=A0A8H4UAB1_9HYPO|nr:hypothetical protein FSARC_777 [Fusarium sarcochroum]